MVNESLLELVLLLLSKSAVSGFEAKDGCTGAKNVHLCVVGI